MWSGPNYVEHDAGMNPDTFAKTHRTPPDQRAQTFKEQTKKMFPSINLLCCYSIT